MSRARASVPPEAIRIEDEVWEDAFARREPARPRPERRLHAIDGGQARPARPRAAQAPAVEPREPAPAPAAGGVPGRRTVTIRGHGAERNLPWPDGSSRRPQRRAYERAGFKPDRVAMWAVMLGILLVIVAIASPHS